MAAAGLAAAWTRVESAVCVGCTMGLGQRQCWTASGAGQGFVGASGRAISFCQMSLPPCSWCQLNSVKGYAALFSLDCLLLPHPFCVYECLCWALSECLALMGLRGTACPAACAAKAQVLVSLF
jgi:hypothetical protein